MAKKRDERGAGKVTDSIRVTKKNEKMHFWVPVPVCRELGVQEGGTLEFRRRELENGEVEYVLRPVVQRDCITGETGGRLVEFQGKYVSQKTIMALAEKLQELTDEGKKTETGKEDETVGDRIKRLRKETGFTQKQIQEKTGISSGNLSTIEKGTCLPSSEAVLKLSGVFRCTTDYLLTGRNSSWENNK